MPTPAITDGTTQFFNILYDGNGTGQRIGKFLPYTDNGTIAKSVIMDKASSPRLSRTPSSAGNRKTFTLSMWIKRCLLGSPRHMILTVSNSGGTAGDFLYFNTDNTIKFTDDDSGDYNLVTTRTFEDTSRFYHLLVAVDTTQSTASNRVKIYIDGDQITSFGTESYPAQDYDFHINNSVHPMNIFSDYGSSGSEYSDGYIAEANLVDGTALTPSTFGLTDTSTGKWIPKSLTGITYGTNGFRMQFANSAGQTIGDDTSGNGNDYTVTNIATTDIVTDSPTQNHCVLSSGLSRGSVSLSEGSTKLISSAANYACCATTMSFSEEDSQGYYFEVKVTGSTRNTTGVLIMRDSVNVDALSSDQQHAGCFGILARGGGGSNQYWFTADGSYDGTTGVSHGANDVIQVAFKEGKVWFGINNTYLLSGNPATGANPTFSNIAGEDFRFLICTYENRDILECNFGRSSFAHTAPSGFVALQEDNRPTTTKGKPGISWFKAFDNTNNHLLIDSSRGGNKQLQPNLVYGELTQEDMIQKFLPGGYQVEDFVNLNDPAREYISWNWVVNEGTTSANTDGSGATLASTIQANQTAGCSIVQYTGNNTAGAKVAHGLSQKPKTFWIKNRDQAASSDAWYVYWEGVDNSVSEDYYMLLNDDAGAVDDATVFNDTAPTSSVFTIGNHVGVNTNTENYIAYCFHSVEGFSRIDRYLGNGNASGPYVFCGFEPQFLMLKCSDAAGAWNIYDNARNKLNPKDKIIQADSAAAEITHASNYDIDFLSNGFKIRNSTSSINHNGRFFQFMAIAKNPFIGDGTNPGTAR